MATVTSDIKVKVPPSGYQLAPALIPLTTVGPHYLPCPSMLVLINNHATDDVTVSLNRTAKAGGVLMPPDEIVIAPEEMFLARVYSHIHGVRSGQYKGYVEIELSAADSEVAYQVLSLTP